MKFYCVRWQRKVNNSLCNDNNCYWFAMEECKGKLEVKI